MTKKGGRVQLGELSYTRPLFWLLFWLDIPGYLDQLLHPFGEPYTMGT